ncbi:hypothetical protein KEM56_001810 [Ascosphaera pollenicola]|nr:hypothetical protein KEM56_001810 [Ascosphaera pollenicola]
MSPLLDRVSKWCHCSHHDQSRGDGYRQLDSEPEPLPPYSELDERHPPTGNEHDSDDPLERTSTCSTYVEYVKQTKEEEKAERKRRRRQRRREEWKKWTYEPNAYFIVF